MSIFYRAFVFISVCLAWIFFRSTDLDFAIEVSKSCLFLNGIENIGDTYLAYGIEIPSFIKTYGGVKLIGAIVLTLFILKYVPNAHEIKIKHSFLTVILMAALFILCLSFVDRPSPFIYFQF